MECVAGAGELGADDAGCSRAKATQLFELAAKRMQQEQAMMERQLIGPRRVSKNRREPVKWPGLEIAPAV